MPDVAREARRRKRAAEPTPRGAQTLARGPGPLNPGGLPQILAPEFPPRAPAPPMREVQPPARGLALLRRGLARPAQTPEILRRGAERRRLDPEILRLEAGRGQHRDPREVEGGAKLPLSLPAGLERRDPLRRPASLQRGGRRVH